MRSMYQGEVERQVKIAVKMHKRNLRNKHEKKLDPSLNLFPMVIKKQAPQASSTLVKENAKSRSKSK